MRTPKNKERDAAIVNGYLKGWKLKDIAAFYGITVGRVSQICKRWLSTDSLDKAKQESIVNSEDCNGVSKVENQNN